MAADGKTLEQKMTELEQRVGDAEALIDGLQTTLEQLGRRFHDGLDEVKTDLRREIDYAKEKVEQVSEAVEKLQRRW